ncbi:UNVERIFIED_CONTAM: hypothetical protein GTU68_034109, partial [Idotea baltica]|nr:hypothetical protein [Idotea baltica]
MIKLENVSIQNGTFQVSNISLEFPSGSYNVIAGPTGSGKSTLLEAIVGLRPISGGSISIDGNVVSSKKPGLRGIGYVPQDVSLFPRMKVENQIGFSLDVRGVDPKCRSNRVEELLQILELYELRNRRPNELSGGQQQRVAIGRALAFEPKLLCLDEPLSAIDVEQRLQLVSFLKQIRQTHATTILHVTHQKEDLQSIDFDLFDFRDGQI